MKFLRLSFSKKQIIINILKITIVLLVLFLIVYISLDWGIRDIVIYKRWLDPKFITVAISLALGFLLAVVELKLLEELDAFLDKTTYALQNAFKGNWGEKKTFAKLKEILGQERRYKIYTNFQIPDTKFDNDAIILGPKGIISIEVKNIKGKFDFIGEETYKHEWCSGDECLCKLNEYHSPIKEVIRHSIVLEEWLAQSGYKDIKIKKAVLMVGSRFKINKIENPVVYIVSGLNNLVNFIKDSYDDPRFTPEFCQKLSDIFDKI